MDYYIRFLIFASIVLTVFATAVFIGIFLQLAVGYRRPKAFIVGTSMGLLTFAGLTCASVKIPPAVRYVELPIIIGAISAVIVISTEEWSLLLSAPRPACRSAWRDVVVAGGGILGACLGVASHLGKPVLNALHQNVVGHMTGEAIEIGVVGGIVGFIVGSFIVVIVWSCLGRRT